VNTASGTQKGYLGFVDLNHDGNMDLVIADLSSNTLVPMLGNGNGKFKPPVRYLAGTQPGSLGIIPLADGNTALLTVDDATGDVVVAFAFADGTLTTPQVSLVGKNPTAIAAGDLNGDGKPDLVVADQDTGNIYVLLNGTDGCLIALAKRDAAGHRNGTAPRVGNAPWKNLDGGDSRCSYALVK